MSDEFSTNLISLEALLFQDYSFEFKKDSAIMITPDSQRALLTKDYEDMWIIPWDYSYPANRNQLTRIHNDMDILPEGKISARSLGV